MPGTMGVLVLNKHEQYRYFDHLLMLGMILVARMLYTCCSLCLGITWLFDSLLPSIFLSSPYLCHFFRDISPRFRALCTFSL